METETATELEIVSPVEAKLVGFGNSKECLAEVVRTYNIGQREQFAERSSAYC